MALILAVLYFGLIELLLIDSSRELATARRFRARVIAQTLAENAAEGAALRLVDAPAVKSASFAQTNQDGEMDGTSSRAGNDFELTGTGKSAGLEGTKASVWVKGQINGNKISIHFTTHSQ